MKSTLPRQPSVRVHPRVGANVFARPSGPSPAMAAAFLLITVLLTYAPALRGGLLWDDNAHLTRPELRSLHGLWRIWFDVGATQQFYPLLHSAFWFEHRLFGDATWGYHLVNLAAHTGVALLVFATLRRLAIPGAFFAAMVFALHPVQVETVAWISELKNTLSGLFNMAALLVYLRFDGSRRRSEYILATLLFGGALLSKTVTATLPAAILVILWWQRGRLRWREEVAPLVPWFATGAASGLFTAWVERHIVGADTSVVAMNGIERVLLAGRVVWFYLGKLVWPADLMFIYPRWKIDAAVAWQYLFPFAVIAALLGLWVWRRRERAPLAGALIFVGTLFPVLGFFNLYPFRYSFVADHFQYLASLGVLVPACAAAACLIQRLPPAAAWGGKLSAALFVAALAVASNRQATNYADLEALYVATLERNPACWLAHTNLGDALQRKGRFDEAIAHYEAVLTLNPEYADIRNNLGYALLRAGRIPEAIVQFETGLRARPEHAEMHYNLGDALLYAGRPLDAIPHYRAALVLKPDFTEVHGNLGYALLRAGWIGEALLHYRIAVGAHPEIAELHYNYGAALLQAGHAADSIVEFEACLRLNPDFVDAQNNLAIVRQQIADGGSKGGSVR